MATESFTGNDIDKNDSGTQAFAQSRGEEALAAPCKPCRPLRKLLSACHNLSSRNMSARTEHEAYPACQATLQVQHAQRKKARTQDGSTHCAPHVGDCNGRKDRVSSPRAACRLSPKVARRFKTLPGRLQQVLRCSNSDLTLLQAQTSMPEFA